MSEIEIKVPNIGDFKDVEVIEILVSEGQTCLLYTSPSPRDEGESRMPSSA